MPKLKRLNLTVSIPAEIAQAWLNEFTDWAEGGADPKYLLRESESLADALIDAGLAVEDYDAR